MTDNLTTQTASLATVPTASTIATDDVGGVHYQRMKLVDGTDGASTGAKVTSEGNLQAITPNRTASGTLGALNDAVTISAVGIEAVVISFTGTLVGDVKPEVSLDGTNWAGWQAWDVNSLLSLIHNPFEDSPEYYMRTGGYHSVRLRVSDYGSGSTTATMVGGSANFDFGHQFVGLVNTSTGAVLSSGGGTQSTALRVTVASDSTGVLSVDDNDGSLTVDAASLPLPTGAATSALQTQPGVDIGDVTVNNAAGASAVNVQDGGNSLTVDGTVTANLAAGTNNIGDVDVLTLPAIPAGNNNIGDVDVASIAAGDNNIGNVDIVTMPNVTLAAGTNTNEVVGDVAHNTAAAGNPLLQGGYASAAAPTDVGADGRAVNAWHLRNGAAAVNITAAGALIAGDASNGLDVDVTRLPALVAGNANIGDVDIASIAAGTNYVGKVRLTDGTLDSSLVDETGTNAVDAVAVGGGTPHDSVDSGNPVKVGMKAQNALPTAVANNDRANAISDLWGRQMTTHIDPAQQKHANKNWTSSQTGTDVITPTSGKKLAITSVVIGTYGTTAGRIILWFGDNADTTFNQDTDQVLVAFSSAPSSTSKPGLVFTPAVPVFCTTADRELHITTDANISLDATIEYYEW